MASKPNDSTIDEVTAETQKQNSKKNNTKTQKPKVIIKGNQVHPKYIKNTKKITAVLPKPN